MTSREPPSSRQESPAFFDADETTLFGIMTRPHPTIDPLGILAIVLTAGGTMSADRNRLGVRLCRHVAELGLHALRFDYRGTGESDGSSPRFRLDQPFTEDLRGALEWARRAGLERVVLIGSCFGARTALACAPEIGGLAGLALIAAPVRDYEMGDRIATALAESHSLSGYARHALKPRVIRGLLDTRKRRSYARIAGSALRDLAASKGVSERDGAVASQLFVTTLAKSVRRRVPMLFVYGAKDDLWRDFTRARSGALGQVLDDGSDFIEVLTLPGEAHGFKSVTIQDGVIRGVGGWLSRLDSRVEVSPG